MVKKWVLFFLCLAVLSVNAQGVIKSFSSSEIGEADTFIRGEFDESLANAKPTEVRPGKFYMRQKFEDPFDDSQVNYQIFSGIATDAKVKLKKFEFKNVDYQELIKYKFYLSSSDDPDFDIERVYFDGNYVYVEYGSNLFYLKGGSMVSTQVSDEKPFSVSISSTPVDASVKINGIDKGRTPIEFLSTETRPMVVTLAKDGYYSIQLLEKPSGADLNLNGILIEAKELKDPSNPILGKISELQSGSPTQTEIDQAKADAEEAINQVNSSYTAAESHARSNFPSAPGQASFEGGSEYSMRQQTRDQSLQEYLTALENKKAAILRQLEEGVSKLENMVPGGAVAQESSYQEDSYQEDSYQDESIAESSEAIMDDEDYGAIEDRFSNTDEYWAWTGWTLVGIGTLALVPTITNMLDASSIEGYNDDIDVALQANLKTGGTTNTDPLALSANNLAYHFGLEQKKAANQEAIDTHKSQMVTWGVISALSLIGGVTILSIDF